MPEFSVPSPSTLEGAAAYVAEVEGAFSEGNFQKVSSLIERDFITVWFGMLPNRFVEMIRTIENQSEEVSPFIQFVSLTLAFPLPEADRVRAYEEFVNSAKARNYPYEQLVGHGTSLVLRLSGRPVEALAIADELEKNEFVSPLFDSTMGWALFATVQHGVTAMSAGDFQLALDHFASARMHSTIPSLGFFVRDACVKSALIQALYGDEVLARSLLLELDRIPRTTSWVEAGTDALVSVVEALLTTANHAEALRLLDSINPTNVGEMWPFYIVAVQRITTRMGDDAQSARRLQQYERLPFAHIEGQGFPGSVLPIWRTYSALASGDLESAQKHLAKADQNLTPVKGTQALCELLRGRPREALAIASEMRASTANFRRFEILRLSVVAGAHLQLGERDACKAALRTAMDVSGGIQPYEATWFPQPVQELAAREFEGWPHLTPEPNKFSEFPSQQERLTDRELEILRALARGLTREQIAKEDYVSINTVKGHLRVLYRKLGVTSRSAAVIEGERRGLL